MLCERQFNDIILLLARTSVDEAIAAEILNFATTAVCFYHTEATE